MGPINSNGTLSGGRIEILEELRKGYSETLRYLIHRIEGRGTHAAFKFRKIGLVKADDHREAPQ